VRRRALCADDIVVWSAGFVRGVEEPGKRGAWRAKGARAATPTDCSDSRKCTRARVARCRSGPIARCVRRGSVVASNTHARAIALAQRHRRSVARRLHHSMYLVRVASLDVLSVGRAARAVSNSP